MGKLTKKMPRQSQYCAMRPPNMGPATPPIGKIEENIPSARSRSCPKWSATIPLAEGKNPPPPSDWISRSGMSM